MSETEKKKDTGEESALLASIAGEAAPEEPEADPGKSGRKKSGGWKVKDIVFIAVVSAAMLVTGAVMVFVANVPVFGIAQLVTALQFSVFPAIGLMKVRRQGCIFLMSLFTGVILVFMAQEMFFTNLTASAVTELIVYVIFRGYSKDAACYAAAALFIPIGIPVYYGYVSIFGSESIYLEAARTQPWIAVGVSAAAAVLALIGALVGIKIARELKKSGVLKK